MCIAILNTPQGKTIDKRTLQNCWENNTHGAGMVYHTKNASGKAVLMVVKELKNFNRFYKLYEEARENNPLSYFVLHFRISTHGKRDKDNCHPFLVTGDCAFVHNGIISDVPTEKNKDKSDTWHFNKHILQPLAEADKDFIKNVGIRRLIRKYIGNYNKLVFIQSDGFAHITNEEAGNWHEGNWYSNYTYRGVSEYIDRGGITVKRTKGGAVRVKGFQANNQYIPATGLNQLEANFGTFDDRGFPIETTDSMRRNKWEVDESVCEECSGPCKDAIERYYGFCTNCLTKYGIGADME